MLKGTFGTVEVDKLQSNTVKKTQPFICRDYTGSNFISPHFIRESSFLSCYNHPNIISLTLTENPIYCDLTTTELSMENGGTCIWNWARLSSKAERDKQIISIFFQIVSALASIHSAGIMHGDLTSANIVLSSSMSSTSSTSTVKIIDWGSVFADTSIFTSYSKFDIPVEFYRCNSSYTSPEMANITLCANEVAHARSRMPLSEKHDIFSLGMVLLYILRAEDINKNFILDCLNESCEEIITEELMNLATEVCTNQQLLQILRQMLQVDHNLRPSAAFLYCHAIFDNYRCCSNYRKLNMWNVYQTLSNTNENRIANIDWIYEVCKQVLKLHCFVLAVGIYDNFNTYAGGSGATGGTSIRLLKLIATTSLIISDALLNSGHHSLKYWRYVSDYTYKEEEIIQYTRIILETLRGRVMPILLFDSVLRRTQKTISYDIIKWIVMSLNHLNSTEKEKEFIYLSIRSNVVKGMTLSWITDIPTKYRQTDLSTLVVIFSSIFNSSSVTTLCIDYCL
jgi:serine/threonine protein kinase